MSYSTKSQAQAQNEQSFNVVNNSIENLQTTIKNFYNVADVTDLIEVNNDLLNTYLQKGIDKEDISCLEDIQEIVYVVNLQNQFLTSLYKELTNLKS